MSRPATKQRLDVLLVERELADTRSRAQALILAGSVYVDGQKRVKAGEAVGADAVIEVRRPLPYASRGGFKLAAGLDAFGLDVSGRTALDTGASTGGFTDVLLQRGATRVYAVDVGYGQLDYRLRMDERVVPIERTNIRQLEALPGGVLADCGVVDVSFISLKLVLPAMLRLQVPHSWIVALIKPQFEAGQHDVGRGGVVRDPKVHRRVLAEVLRAAPALGLQPRGLIASPLLGPAGNREFLAWLGGEGPAIDIDAAIEHALVTTTRQGDEQQA